MPTAKNQFLNNNKVYTEVIPRLTTCKYTTRFREDYLNHLAFRSQTSSGSFDTFDACIWTGVIYTESEL